MLKDVSFTIKPGQVVGVVGTTGGGKSTVVSLIPRFYDPTGGRVLIDGVDVRDYKLASAALARSASCCRRRCCSAARSRENIAYGRPGRDRGGDRRRGQARQRRTSSSPRCRTATTRWSASAALTLSGGQRQRIGIARAVIRDTPILILDEPTAALDTESERLVIEGLERLMKGRTVITIAHRLSTIRDADKIIVLEGRRRGRAGHARRAARSSTASTPSCTTSSSTTPAAATATPTLHRHLIRTAYAMSHSLIVLPDDTAKPIARRASTARSGRCASRCSCSPTRRCSRRCSPRRSAASTCA